MARLTSVVFKVLSTCRHNYQSLMDGLCSSYRHDPIGNTLRSALLTKKT